MQHRTDLLAVVLPIARALRRIEDRAAAEESLTMWQYAILAVVEQRPDLNQGEVAALLDYSKNRIIGDLDELEARGYVTRRPGADRRANQLGVTPAGVAVCARVQARIHDGEDELLGELPPALVTQFAATAREIAAHIRPDIINPMSSTRR